MKRQRTVPEEPVQEESNETENAGNTLPNECYPKDVLTPQDLLPQDSNSTEAQTVQVDRVFEEIKIS